MAQSYQAQIDAFMDKVRAKNPNEPEFLQAVHEVAESVIPFIGDHPKYQDANILDISHHRVFTSTPAKGARTIFEIETRDRQHLDDVVSAISAHGYTVSLRGPDEI